MDVRAAGQHVSEERWLATLREIAARVLGPYSVDLVLFGSRARGTAREASDIHGRIPQHAATLDTWLSAMLRRTGRK